jgi:hypothetical protein
MCVLPRGAFFVRLRLFHHALAFILTLEKLHPNNQRKCLFNVVSKNREHQGAGQPPGALK